MGRNVKILDFDTHLSYENKPNATTGDGMLRLMDEAGVAQSIITLQCGLEPDEPCDYEGLNRYIYEQAKAHPDRFYPMGWINPRLWDLEECKKQIEIQKNDYGFRIVKLNGGENYFDLLDPVRSLPVIDELCRQGMMISYHSAAEGRTNPSKIGKLASLHPDTPMFLIHMGQTANQEALEAAIANENIYLVGSFVVDMSYLLKAVKAIGSKRVIFGTDAPFIEQGTCVKIYETLLAGLTDEEYEDVMGGNMRRILGIS